MKWLCFIIGHRWNKAPWLKSQVSASPWKREIKCARCSKTKIEFSNIKY